MNEQKTRIIQEFVPGKQITLAHIIANPIPDLCDKLGIITEGQTALGVLTITPTEAAIIAADVASKAAGVNLAFVDRFSGSLVLTGDVESVEAAIIAVLDAMKNILHFEIAPITRT